MANFRKGLAGQIAKKVGAAPGMVEAVLSELPSTASEVLQARGKFTFPNFFSVSMSGEEHAVTKEELATIRIYAKANKVHSDHVRIVKPSVTLKKKWVIASSQARDASPKVIMLGDIDRAGANNGCLVREPAPADAAAVIFPVADCQSPSASSSASSPSSGSR